MAELDYQYIAGLVDQARAGSSDAFAELYAATYKKQYLFACGYLKDDYLAQDAVQETFILAFKNLPSLMDSKLFISWLNQINFRVCYDMNMKQKQFNVISTEEDILEALPAARSYEPEVEVVRVDEKRYIIEQIMSLPFSESQAIYLYYYQNMKIDDIAYIMEISRSTVKRYLKTGKERLKKLLTI